MIYDQAEFDIRCEWGEQGVLHLAPVSDVVIIVDVLSFSTCVSIAAARGVEVFPCRDKGEAAEAFARSVDAELATRRGAGGWSLSPASLTRAPAGLRLVLPSPNGSTLTLATGDTPTLVGCLRNARTVARAAVRLGTRIAVIPAGERWRTDWSLRPSVEDWLGAGAIIQHLLGSLSPEARMAADAFRSAEMEITAIIAGCSSGKELIAGGFGEDVALASDIDADRCAPLLKSRELASGEYARYLIGAPF
ncbi:MAG: 2-phosphosulfolactate phosphatase [Anaerolineae bacterium]|nr:2-phosphosulfolactate phosphatase [Anaerolineae bacterium]HRX02298.1 2-phosphosulfolactate phosphatase [Anaerolineae bacterium]